MAEEKSTKVEEKKETKKLDDVKNTEENKKVIAESEGKVESKPAVKKSKAAPKGEIKIELEREYVIPLRREARKVPRYRRAKKAVKAMKEFLAKHMKVEGRDLKKVKIDIYLNNEVWFRGIKKPLHKVKVKAVKKGGIVYAELAELPKVVEFAKARFDKRAKAAEAGVKAPRAAPKEEVADKDGDGIEDKKEEAEDKKAGAEKAVKTEKAAVKTTKHTAKGAHLKKVAPVRKSLKK
jgi:large subunit ribosomal protein L31e